MRAACPRAASPAPSSASAPSAPQQSYGAAPSYRQEDRSSVPRQSERRQQAPSGRVYAAQVEDSTAADRLVAGIILISSTRARTLFDTGASHSFVSRAFAQLHGLELGALSQAREVQIPDLVLQVVECCWSCPVQLDSWILPADLLVLGQLQDFDVVLGIDWLARYYATIDCGARTVTFREPGQEEFTFRGCRIRCLPPGYLRRGLDICFVITAPALSSLFDSVTDR
uniref:Uncharacterized protein n=1 Tax=Ananas comosus var. bracteatus TaxID=296719 RepID=A0A6V7Q267_ANACO|nr:unnamed protein product [Ananas comosus var. bracteatus]